MAKRLLILFIFFITVIVFFIISNSLNNTVNLATSRLGMDIQAALNFPQSSDFQQVIGHREFTFPDDHGPHPDYGVEWWYFTGNLSTEDKRHFGYQLTFFRVGLGQGQVKRESLWSTSQLYMGNLALSDVQNTKFYAFERVSREALDFSGAVVTDEGNFRIWIDDWIIDGAGSDLPTVRILAKEGLLKIDLTLQSTKPVILNGQLGLSRKNQELGGASYYYSCTRMATEGFITLGKENMQVAGLSWMDREWSTSALSEKQIGWDWFGLQLSDGRDLMLYQFLTGEGKVDSNSSGTIIEQDGTYHFLNFDDFAITNLDHWISRISGTQYPSTWQIEIPDHGLDITIKPYFEDQEFNGIIRYWEGAVSLVGSSDSRFVTGSGYVEMTRSTSKTKLK